MTSDPRRWLSFALSIPGVVAFFLPFAAGVSPFRAAFESSFTRSEQIFALGGLLAGLAIPIAALQIRFVISECLSRFEISASLALGLLASPLVLGSWLLPVGWPERRLLLEFLILLAPAAILTVVLPILALRLRRHVAQDSDVSQAFLVSGYCSNAFAFLVASEFDEIRLDVGAYVVLLACTCYVAMILLVARRRSTTRLEPGV